METMISYIERETQTTDLNNKTWKNVVDTVIFPQLAGPIKTRWCINDMFMNFVAEFSQDISRRDSYTATAMLEVALQRLSCGAVIHERTPWPEPLPEEYWDYSSKWDEAHIMTAGCYNFIMKAIETCLKNETTHSHACKILFGLMKQLSPNGEVEHGYYALSDFKKNAAELFAHAAKLAEEYATFDELYEHYAQPGQWQKHKLWFAKNTQKLNWKKFFAATSAVEGEFFKRWRQQQSIKNELKRLNA